MSNSHLRVLAYPDASSRSSAGMICYILAANLEDIKYTESCAITERLASLSSSHWASNNRKPNDLDASEMCAAVMNKQTTFQRTIEMPLNCLLSDLPLLLCRCLTPFVD